LGIYENVEVQWVPGAVPTAFFLNSEGNTVKEAEVGDISLDTLLQLFSNNGFTPQKRKANYPETPTAQTSFGNHHYELYNVDGFFDEAETFAQSKSHNGEPGYLLTISSAEENNAISQMLLENAVQKVWLGARDDETEGTWKWINGPEKGDSFYPFEDGKSAYENWNNGEPNNVDKEDCASLVDKEGWNDVSCRSVVMPVVVEYGSERIISSSPAVTLEPERAEL